MRRLLLGLIAFGLFWTTAAEASLVQNSAVTCGGSVANRQVTLTGTTAGNLIVVAGTYFAAGTTITVSDSVNGTYTQVFVQAAASDSHRTSLSYKANIAGGTVTITYTPPSAADTCIIAAEFNGIATVSPLNTSNSTNGTGTTANSSSITTTQATTTLIAVEGQGTSGSITQNAGSQGFTLIGENESGASAEPISFVYRVVTSTGSYNHTWTVPNDDWAAGIGAFLATNDTTPPSDPTSLQATAAGSSQIDLTWTASTDDVAVSVYRVEQCQGAGCVNFSEVAQPTATSYSAQSLNASTLYRFRVRAQDAANNLSGYSNIAQATTGAAGDAQAPTQPSSPDATAPGASGVDLAWGVSTDNVAVSGYRIERCAGAACVNFAEIATTSSELAYADRGLTADTLYRYRVRAVDPSLNFSTYSTIVEARTRTTSPTLTWADNSSNETSFIIARRAGCGSSASFSDIATVSAGTTTWSDTTAQNSEMEYRVRASNSAGDSATTGTVCWVKDKPVRNNFSGRDPTVPSVGVRQR